MPDENPNTVRAWLRNPATVAILSLGITQLCAWGTTLYALGVLGAPISQATGWSRSLVFGGLTLGLLVSALISRAAGKQIDRRGGRIMMTIGSVLAGIGLVALAYNSTPTTYLLSWALLGVAMRLTLYDAAFPSLVQVTPSRGRRAISAVTLFGGFASSVFWPIGHWLNSAYGWRTTLIIFALINLLICLPLHWFGLARREATPADPSASTTTGIPAHLAARDLNDAERQRAMILFGIVLGICGAVMGTVASHLVSIIATVGVPLSVAVGLAAFKGVAQTAGRAVEMTFGQKLHAITLARLSLFTLPFSFIVLILGGANFSMALAFTLLLGVSNGLVTIVRGALPLAIFGARGYATVLGTLAMPYLVMYAVAPLAYAVLVDVAGQTAGIYTLIAVSFSAVAVMEIMASWYRRLPAPTA